MAVPFGDLRQTDFLRAMIIMTQQQFWQAGLVLMGALLMVGTTPAGWAGHDGADVKRTEIKVGVGTEVVRFAKVRVHYTGWLMDGTKFDSSLDRGRPFEFQVGAARVIPGWEMGVLGMKVGGKRELVIPPELAYGKTGAGNAIPPDSTLKFEIKLLDVTPPPFTSIDNETLQRNLEQGVKLIDIRRPDEWKETGVIEGSILITAFDVHGRFIKSFPGELKKHVQADQEFMIICRTGNRTSILANALVEQGGYKSVLNIENGIVDWMKEKRPVTQAINL